ncbi:MAG: 3-isopropylmalate dehydrogenase [Candidatus Aerophobetes bacterium]|nr:3-isopropylmalate dehydrogenase [Candidatus Aerophobetes bacterium]
MSKYLIAVLAGDGIGPEVMREALEILTLAGKVFSHSFEIKRALAGGEAIDKTGKPLPEETLTLCKEADAILFGAVGGPKWDGLSHEARPEQALLGLRSEFDLFINLRPIKIYKSLLPVSPLKEKVIKEGIDILMVRELRGGIYFGRPRGRASLPNGTIKAVNTLSYTEKEIERIVRAAFDFSLDRSGRVTSVDKANVLESSQLWREVVKRVSKDYPQVKLNHLYIDNCAMQLIKDPHQFDVIVTGNIFGDILSDEAGMLTGSIGMLASASLGKGKIGFFEPVHGSAPDIAGKNRANPLGMIMSVALMLRHNLSLVREAKAIEEAVERVLEKGYRTDDLKQRGKKLVGTREMGRIVRKELRNGG